MGNHQQQAFFYSPLPSPKNILIICGGNASLALDWLYFVKHLPEKHLGVLLIDYPGYGHNKGYPSQKHNKVKKIRVFVYSIVSWCVLYIKEICILVVPFVPRVH